MEQPKLALLDFREALSIDSTLADAWGQLGVAYIELQQYELAIEAMNQALKYDIDNADYWYNRGNAYFNLQDYKNAITNYSKSIEINSTIDAVYNRALSYYLDNQFNLAIPDFSAYLQVESADAQAWYLRCLCNYELGRKENACSDCEMAVFLGSTEVPASMIKYCGIKKKKKK
jgi:tetratricopeptide (TPR) repeat protein